MAPRGFCLLKGLAWKQTPFVMFVPTSEGIWHPNTNHAFEGFLPNSGTIIELTTSLMVKSLKLQIHLIKKRKETLVPADFASFADFTNLDDHVHDHATECLDSATFRLEPLCIIRSFHQKPPLLSALYATYIYIKSQEL